MATSAKSTAIRRLERENIGRPLLPLSLPIIQHFEHLHFTCLSSYRVNPLCEPLSADGTLSRGILRVVRWSLEH